MANLRGSLPNSAEIKVHLAASGPKGDRGDAFKFEDFTPEQLESLRGPQGEPGPIGPSGKFEDLTPEQKEELRGYQGETGPKGEPFKYEDFTPQQLEDLRGPVGPTGETGPKGDAPVRGVDYWTQDDIDSVVLEATELLEPTIEAINDNKVSAITEENKSSTENYPSNKAMTDYVSDVEHKVIEIVVNSIGPQGAVDALRYNGESITSMEARELITQFKDKLFFYFVSPNEVTAISNNTTILNDSVGIVFDMGEASMLILLSSEPAMYIAITYQPALKSGENIKTINNQSLLGSGDIEIKGGDGVSDVQINGASILQDGVANIPVVSKANELGLIKFDKGFSIVGDYLRVSSASQAQIKSGGEIYNKLSPSIQHESTFYGLAKASGTDEKNSTLPLGQYTEGAQASIQRMIGIVTLTQEEYDLIEVKSESTIYVIVG